MKKILLALVLATWCTVSLADFGRVYLVRLKKQPECSVQQMLDQARAIGWSPVTKINPRTGGHGAMNPAYLAQIKAVVDNPVFDQAAYDSLDASLAPLFSGSSCINFRGVQGPDDVRAGYPVGVDTATLKASLGSSGQYTNNGQASAANPSVILMDKTSAFPDTERYPVLQDQTYISNFGINFAVGSTWLNQTVSDWFASANSRLFGNGGLHAEKWTWIVQSLNGTNVYSADSEGNVEDALTNVEGVIDSIGPVNNGGVIPVGSPYGFINVNDETDYIKGLSEIALNNPKMIANHISSE